MILFEPPRDKTNKVTVRPAKTQISLGIRPVWSESLLSAWRKLGSLATHWAQAKTLIRLGGCPGISESSLGAHATLLVLSWGGSFFLLKFCFAEKFILSFVSKCPFNLSDFVLVWLNLAKNEHNFQEISLEWGWKGAEAQNLHSEDSNQPAHPRILIRAFAVYLKKHNALGPCLPIDFQGKTNAWMCRLIWVLCHFIIWRR